MKKTLSPFLSPRFATACLLLMLLTSMTGCTFLKSRDWPAFWRAKSTITPIPTEFPDYPLDVPGPITLENPDGVSIAPEAYDPLAPGSPTETIEVLEPIRPVDPVETQQVQELQTIYFAYNSPEITPAMMLLLEANAKWIYENVRDRKINIEGHCDERGTEEYNLSLSGKRAESVRLALAQMGLDASLLATIPYGESRPVDPGHNESAWSKNRRVQFLVQFD